MTTESSHTHQNWIASKSTDATAAVTAEDATTMTAEDMRLSLLTDPSVATPNDVSALLVSTLSLASSSGNTHAQDLIEDALNALHDA